MARYDLKNPQIEEDLYPGRADRVSDFSYDTRLVLAREPESLRTEKLSEVSYIVDQDYKVSFTVTVGGGDIRKTVTVPRGMLTDLASVPRLARWIVGRVGPHLEASIVHDFLYVAWQLLPEPEAREEDFEFANAVMFAGIENTGLSWAERNAIKSALSLPYFAWSVYRDTNLDSQGRGPFVDLDNPLP